MEVRVCTPDEPFLKLANLPLQKPGTNRILAVMITQPVMLGPPIVIPASCGSTP